MEVATADDSSGANPSSVKSEDGSPRPEGGKGSPPPNCAICLGKCRNKSFTDSCLHQFCFKCLLTWSKVKTECPLCKQNFKSIIHNVRSNHQYEEYPVQQRRDEELESMDISELVSATRRFRYRTTLTLPRRETLAIQQFLMHYPLAALMNDMPPSNDRRRSPGNFRRTVYRHNLWARPLPDFTGRFRDCSPEFFRYNDSQIHRLVPWLNRELYYLLNENHGHIAYVLSRILELLPQYHITSAEFTEAMQRYFGDRTQHFLHEFYCFASTPYDITGYDRNVQYTTDSRVSNTVNQVISSSDSEASHDSDIVMVSSSHPSQVPYEVPGSTAGPSRLTQSSSIPAPAPVYPRNYIPQPSDNIIPIETISHSDTDSESEVMVTGYIKPPHQRTPEVVDLVGSDSDVVMQELTPPEPARNTEAQENQSRAATVVKVTVSTRQKTPEVKDSDSDDEAYTPPPPPPPRRKRRPRTASLASSDSCRSPSPTVSSLAYSPPRTPSPKSSSTDSSSFSYYSSDSSSSSSERRSRAVKRKTKRKVSRETSSRSRRKARKRSPKQKKYKKNHDESSQDKDKRRKCKSRNGKGVKSTKTVAIPAEAPPEQAQAQPAPDEPGPSGVATTRKTKSSADSTLRRASRENKRLRSVVNVMNHQKAEGSSGTMNGASKSSGRIKRPRLSPTATSREAKRDHSDTYTSDSEDNIPLHLTIPKLNPH